MLDWLGGILSAGGGIADAIASLFGDDESDELSREAAEMSRRALDASLAPQRNARGDVISYGGPNVGWNTQLSPISQALLNSSDQELLKRLTHDVGVRREGINANATRRRDEGSAADTYLRRLTGESGYDEDAVTGDLTEQATRGVTQGYDDASSMILRQLQRSGTPNANAVSKMASMRGRDLSDAILGARIAGPQQFEALESSRTNRLLNPYNTLASRASNIDDIAFQPASFDPGTDATQANAAGRAPYSASASASTLLNSGQALGAENDAFGQIGLNMNGLLGALSGLFDPSPGQGETTKAGNQKNKPVNFMGINF